MGSTAEIRQHLVLSRKLSTESKVYELCLNVPIDQHILEFKIAMHNIQ